MTTEKTLSALKHLRDVTRRGSAEAEALQTAIDAIEELEFLKESSQRALAVLKEENARVFREEMRCFRNCLPEHLMVHDFRLSIIKTIDIVENSLTGNKFEDEKEMERD